MTTIAVVILSRKAAQRKRKPLLQRRSQLKVVPRSQSPVAEVEEAAEQQVELQAGAGKIHRCLQVCNMYICLNV